MVQRVVGGIHSRPTASGRRQGSTKRWARWATTSTVVPAPLADDDQEGGAAMATASSHQETHAGITREAGSREGTREGGTARGARLTSEQVWQAVARASFCVVSYVTPAG